MVMISDEWTHDRINEMVEGYAGLMAQIDTLVALAHKEGRASIKEDEVIPIVNKMNGLLQPTGCFVTANNDAPGGNLRLSLHFVPGETLGEEIERRLLKRSRFQRGGYKKLLVD